MANILVSTLTIVAPVNDPGGGSYDDGDVFEVFYDDVAKGLVVELNGVVVTDGPLLPVGTVQINAARARYCDGTTRVEFRADNSPVVRTFPYYSLFFIENAAICSSDAPVCDLAWSGIPTVVNETSLAAQDGSISVVATSSNGPIKYALFDFDYANEGQSSGVFTGLGKAKYRIYAKDAQSCIKVQEVRVFRDDVDTDDALGVKYRLEYYDLMNNKEYAEVYERGYSGEVIEVSGYKFPIVGPTLRGENRGKLQFVIGSEMLLGLMNEEAGG